MAVASFLIVENDSLPSLLGKIKGAVAAEYIQADENFEESSLNVLVKHHDTFEWMDVSLCIPADSTKEYPSPLAGKLSVVPTK